MPMKLYMSVYDAGGAHSAQLASEEDALLLGKNLIESKNWGPWARGQPTEATARTACSWRVVARLSGSPWRRCGAVASQ